jgi:dipeptidyl aminopeptidase/acylaminoacyl peptidase
MKVLSFTLLLCSSLFVTAQKENVSTLQLNQIMKGKDFIGYWPEYHYWHVDGEQIIFQWNPKNELEASAYTYSTKTKKIQPVDLTIAHAEIAFDYSQSNYTHQYYLHEGNLWVWDKANKTCKPIISTEERITKIHRLTDPNLICFQKGLNLFLLDAKNGTTKQLSFIKKGAEKAVVPNKEDELSRQQEDLFQFIQDEKALNEFRKNKRIEPKANPNFYLGEQELDFIQISKDGKYVFMACGNYPTTKETHVEHHVTTDGYTQTTSARPKVGQSEPTHNFYIQDLTKDTIIQLSFSTLPDIRKKPEFRKEYSDFEELYTEDRKIVFHSPISSENGLSVMDIRSYDNKDRWIVQILPSEMKFELIDQQHDEAWIGGPGISSWNQSTGALGFWNKGEDLYFQSEETGYSHLYAYNLKTKKKTQLTSGEFEIYDVSLSSDKSNFYLTSNKTHPGNRDFYKFQPTKKEWTEILVKEGAHEVLLAPDEKNLAVLYSNKTNPWELFISKNEKSSSLVQLTKSISPAFASYTWQSPKVINFKGEDQEKIYARLYSPLKENKNNAAVVFVHGAGYLQNAHNYWSNYYREFMFHNLLVDNGYTVLDIDFRASQGYGRNHRTAVYRHMGGWDLQDNITGKNVLVDSLGIDPDRVGIYGGSYGGFITLMALLTRPDEFACGAALRSVTDWRHYNHEYTSNILNYPNNDSLAYWRSSPINFAENLNKPLLMLHGMVDDNVQFQDVVRLSQRFIELEKKDWELAVFPVEAHGFVKSYSWTDEYRRIFELFQKKLNNK